MTAKPIRWLQHARDNLYAREIEEMEVLLTLSEPEFVESLSSDRKILMRFYKDSVLNQKMLIRVVVDDTPTETVIVTVYKTSRSSRYIKEKS